MMRRSDNPSRAARRPTAVAVTLALLTLAGCAVGPDYRRPDAGLPDGFTATAAPVEASAALQKEWWHLFQDPQLDELVAQALAQNHDLLSAMARIEEAEGAAREAGAAFIPQVDLKASGSRSQISAENATPLSSAVPRIQDSRKAGFSTSYEIDLWGKLRRADEAARAELLASRYAKDTAELSVAGLVASNYLALRAADASLALTQDTLDSRRKSLEITRSRLTGGTASPLDMHQAESSVAAAEAQLADLRRQRALAETQLGLLTGQPGLSITVGDLRQLPMPPVPPAGLPSTLLEARPDIRQAEESLVAANARIGVAKAALYPSVSLTGALGGESAALSKLFTSGASTWSIGLAAAMPIFDAGRNAARIDQATARQKQTLVSYQKTVHTAFKEVNDALVSLREYGESDRAQERRVQAAQKTLEIAQLRYQAGYSGFLDVLDAQRSANDALLAYVSTRQARLGSAVSLFKALGGGWNDNFKAESLENTGAQAASPDSSPRS
ncbi:efflux transporter outer membrane subunit [Propionivibrio soli]|uniref:efflux transporter outer membrane subunit n=1 Tax=Propionivibrio soli TaxID=2976531 RepID=UPI0021E85CDF|nr:efflux transporter outer membrane subunit [Propionivibrio soli]